LRALLQVLRMLQQKQQLLAGVPAGPATEGPAASTKPAAQALEDAQDDGTGTVVQAMAPLSESLRAHEMRGLLEAVLQ
jgi:hypothetical protein